MPPSRGRATAVPSGKVWTPARIRPCCSGSRQVAPSEQEAAPCNLASLLRFGHLHGVVRLPHGVPIVCGGAAVREDDGPDCYLPLGALGRAEPRSNVHTVDDPGSGSASLTWRRPIDDWMAGVGARIYAAAGLGWV
jgi:hypothetical protein